MVFTKKNIKFMFTNTTLFLFLKIFLFYEFYII